VSETNLFAQQRKNRRRSTVLVTGFLLFFAWVGFGGDLAWYLMSVDAGPETYRHAIPFVGLLTSAVGAGMAIFAWRRGPREVLWSTGAWEMLEPANQQERVLKNVVEEMAIASGLPVPTIWIVPDKDPNAFATGIDERTSHVAVTEGLLTLLDRDQLQAVVAHEMAHIQNHDVKLMTLLAALVGVITLLSDAAHRTARVGARVGGGKTRGSKKSKLGMVVLVLWLVTLLVAPIISRLLALTVSRNREFLADATAAQFTRNPSALAEALRAIEDSQAPTLAIGRGSAHLCIADPLGRRLTHKQGRLADLLATHPPMAMRVARLRAMAFQYEQTGVIPERI
jgi:heat shock protein HtpX